VEDKPILFSEPMIEKIIVPDLKTNDTNKIWHDTKEWKQLASVDHPLPVVDSTLLLPPSDKPLMPTTKIIYDSNGIPNRVMIKQPNGRIKYEKYDNAKHSKFNLKKTAISLISKPKTEILKTVLPKSILKNAAKEAIKGLNVVTDFPI